MTLLYCSHTLLFKLVKRHHKTLAKCSFIQIHLKYRKMFFIYSLSLPSACPASSLSPHVESIWALLFQNCECQEEGTRNLVAECLGKLTLVNAAQLLPRLRQQLKAGTMCEDGNVCVWVWFSLR